MSERASLLLHAGWIIDGTGKLLSGDTFYIEGSAIRQIGAWDRLSDAYPDAMRLEIVDCVVMPGWVIGCSRLEWALFRYHPQKLWLPWEERRLPAWWDTITENDRVIGTRFGVLDLISQGVTRIYDLSHSALVSEILTSCGLIVFPLEAEPYPTGPDTGQSIYPVVDPERLRLQWTTSFSKDSKHWPLIFDEKAVAADKPFPWLDASGTWIFGLPITPWAADLLVRTRYLGRFLERLVSEKGWNGRILRGLWGGIEVTFPISREMPAVPATLTAVQIPSYRSFPEENPVPYLMTRASAGDVFMTMVKGDILYLNSRFYGPAREIAQACLYGWDALSSKARRHFQLNRPNGGTE